MENFTRELLLPAGAVKHRGCAKKFFNLLNSLRRSLEWEMMTRQIGKLRSNWFPGCSYSDLRWAGNWRMFVDRMDSMAWNFAWRSFVTANVWYSMLQLSSVITSFELFSGKCWQCIMSYYTIICRISALRVVQMII